MTVTTTWFTPIVLAGLLLGCPGVQAQSIPDRLGWYELPNTKLRAVCPPNFFGGSDYEFRSFCQNVTGAWSSGAFDTRRNRLIMFGGGHNDYYGNELYALDMDELKMRRITDPGLPIAPGTGCPVAIAGGTQPNSRHTYDGVVYMENVNQLFIIGGAPANLSGCGTNDVWTFDFQSSRWKQINPGNTRPRGDGFTSAYDPVSGTVLVHDLTHLWAFDPSTERFTRLSSSEVNLDLYVMAELDPVKRKYVLLDTNTAKVYVYDVGNNSATWSQLSTTGGSSIISGSGYPGMAYDPNRKQIVAWKGGNSVYSLNLDNGKWSQTTHPAGPGPAIPTGTYKRWRYAPTQGVFVVVNSVDDNAYTLRISTDTTPPPSPPTGLSVH